jgi:1,4-alpha-glucan branching enzyme
MTADGTELIATDPWLAPYTPALRDRYAHYLWRKSRLDAHGGLLGPVSESHHFFGFHRGEREGAAGVWYREWAPGAHYLSLIGDFNGWDRGANPLQGGEGGVWSLFLPDAEYKERLVHGSRLKVHIASGNTGMDRLPVYIRRVIQDADTPHFVAQYWQPPLPYVWQHGVPSTTGALRIYEAHVGMAQEEGKVGTFGEFTHLILPRIAALGYNAIQLMAVMEHPYYGSFGYHVSNFFAVSSRFGTPEELKALVDAAHGLGLKVIMDVVHSHAVKNVDEGLNHFDGTDYQYFHAGERGQHRLWDSLMFDYGKEEVERFLLSNLRFWREEYRFDGFRFDGVTSMLYLDHGIARVFSTYEDYFSDNVDKDALAYLMLANELLHALASDAISIAEDVSGMPGMARPVAEGGLGFDYRLAMGIPDYWVQLLKEKRDEEWSLGEIYGRLLDRRPGEKHVGYVESHDQALVGDKTLAFQLMDQAMYTRMGRHTHDPIIERGVALLKMIRLLTFSLGGEAYLNFMGNEFGHPEWIDFPRPDNGFSYHYARRQWSLADRDDLLYHDLNLFDRALQQLDIRYNLLQDSLIEQLALHEDTHQLIYRRGPLVFAFNFHPSESYADLRIPVPDASDYQVVLNTDDAAFGGAGRVTANVVYPIQRVPMYGRDQSVQIYLPARSAQVLAPLS